MKQSRQQRRTAKRKKNMEKGINYGISKYAQKKAKVMREGKAPAASPFTVFEVESDVRE